MVIFYNNRLSFLFHIFIVFFLFNESTCDADFHLFDDMNNISGWDVSVDAGSDLELKIVPGKKSNGLLLKYNFNSGVWVQCRKKINKDLQNIKKIRFYYQNIGSINTLELELADNDGTHVGAEISLIPTRSNEWKKIEIDILQFKYWWGGDGNINFNKIRQMVLTFSKEVIDSGQIVIDEIKYRMKTAEEMKNGNKEQKKIIDNMDSTSGWNPLAEANICSSYVSNYQNGKKGQALQMFFDLGSGYWAGMVKDIDKNMSGLKKLQFYYKYQGQPNIIEVKLVDNDGSMFGYKYDILKSEEWRLMELKLMDFTYWWGGDNILNLKQIKRIEFFITPGYEELRGQGSLIIDEIEYFY